MRQGLPPGPVVTHSRASSIPSLRLLATAPPLAPSGKEARRQEKERQKQEKAARGAAGNRKKQEKQEKERQKQEKGSRNRRRRRLKQEKKAQGREALTPSKGRWTACPQDGGDRSSASEARRDALPDLLPLGWTYVAPLFPQPKSRPSQGPAPSHICGAVSLFLRKVACSPSPCQPLIPRGQDSQSRGQLHFPGEAVDTSPPAQPNWGPFPGATLLIGLWSPQG